MREAQKQAVRFRVSPVGPCISGESGVRAMTGTGGVVRWLSSGMGDGRAAQPVVTTATSRERVESFMLINLVGLGAGC